MRRREFVTLLGGAAVLGCPRGAPGQPRERMRRIGVISYENENDADERELRDQFTARLRELGWIEGSNLHTDYRFAGNEARNMRDHAKELVDLRPDVIFAGYQAVIALKTITTTIPIVFAGGPDPVAAGLVASLAQPGGNVTGFSNNPPLIATKRLQVLKEIAPLATRIALMYDPGYSSGALQFLAELQAAALSINAEAKGAAVHNPAEIEDALAALAVTPDGGLIVYAGGSTFAYLDKIIASAAKHNIPAIYRDRDYVVAGGLASYGTDGRESYRGAATYVDRILRGAKPSDLPVQQATTFNLVLNLKTAKALGLTVSDALLARADEVIE